MKFIFDLPNKELLPRSLDLADAIEDFTQKFGIKDVKLKQKEGEDDKAFSRRKLKKLLNTICREHPEEAGAISDMMWKKDTEDEEIPNAIATASVAITRKDVVDFFALYLLMGQTDTSK